MSRINPISVLPPTLSTARNAGKSYFQMPVSRDGGVELYDPTPLEAGPGRWEMRKAADEDRRGEEGRKVNREMAEGAKEQRKSENFFYFTLPEPLTPAHPNVPPSVPPHTLPMREAVSSLSIFELLQSLCPRSEKQNKGWKTERVRRGARENGVPTKRTSKRRQKLPSLSFHLPPFKETFGDNDNVSGVWRRLESLPLAAPHLRFPSVSSPQVRIVLGKYGEHLDRRGRPKNDGAETGGLNLQNKLKSVGLPLPPPTSREYINTRL
ncbi:hypothetical protein BDK51DRAFT_33210 [Blyttiomyces helicus]|uniref:Uncharacterized protein n=1 Tax=Blyttiomyces helicus TaxID=388810 RepID=A0A4P9WIM8_9FUNG|nr:hypothetical protein BDK51DRAFT_33210 [Blyttiomyces helicus]|eukprot:RKO92731.1 hypothetical protein BDK51DRAFT_33210 [Blyttiomyces helicus]